MDPHKIKWEKANNYIEVSKVGTKSSKKVNMPSSQKGKQSSLTEFQIRFKAKQTIKHYYGSLSENYLQNIKIATSQKGGESFVCELEKRLDVVVFRLGFASSLLEARNLIKSGLVKINDKKVHSHSYSKPVNVGSKISIDINANNLGQTAYLAKIKHLKFNLFKTPTHLVAPAVSNTYTTQGPTDLKGSLEGYFIQNPIESEVFLPTYSYKKASNFPINKFR